VEPVPPDPAYEFLITLDDPIAQLARDHGEIDFRLPSHGLVLDDHLSRLTLSILGQMISVKAAVAIFIRLQALLGGTITATGLAEAADADLLGVGLSRAKSRAVRELGAEIVSRRLRLEQLDALSDDEAQRRLIALRGIGPWSAQMFLLRSMGRPDVFPAGDLGLRRGIELLDGLPELPPIPAAAERALAWRPYRSYAAKYLWIQYSLRSAL
jgi:DNA-3-methyladenine glycosylase II